MKKFLSLILLVIIGVSTAHSEYRWGVDAGMNISKYGFKQDLAPVTQSIGPQVGVIGELIFPGIGFGLDFGLKWQMEGAKVNLGDYKIWNISGYGNEQVYLQSIQIPINLRFKYTNLNGFEDTIAPFAYGGPVFSITAGHSDCKAFEFPSGYFGLQCGLGAELWQHFQVSASYMWGLSYCIRTVKLDNYSARIGGWQVNLAYFF